MTCLTWRTVPPPACPGSGSTCPPSTSWSSWPVCRGTCSSWRWWGPGRRGEGRLVDTFVRNLAAADLVFTFTLPLWALSAMWDDLWPFGELLCRLSSYAISVNRFSNVFFLTCMSADRYLAVVRPLDRGFPRTARRRRLVCGGVWALSLAPGDPRPALPQRGGAGRGRAGLLRGGRGVPRVPGPEHGLPPPHVRAARGRAPVLLRLRPGPSAPPGRPGKGPSGGPAPELPQDRLRHRGGVRALLAALQRLQDRPHGRPDGGRGPAPAGVESALAQGLILSSCLAFFNSCANPAIYLSLDQHFRRRARALCRGRLGKFGARRGQTSTSESCSGAVSAHGNLFSLNDWSARNFPPRLRTLRRNRVTSGGHFCTSGAKLPTCTQKVPSCSLWVQTSVLSKSQFYFPGLGNNFMVLQGSPPAISICNFSALLYPYFWVCAPPWARQTSRNTLPSFKNLCLVWSHDVSAHSLFKHSLQETGGYLHPFLRVIRHIRVREGWYWRDKVLWFLHSSETNTRSETEKH